MCQASTQAGEALLVAGLEPGEATRVRVATTTGFVPYAYPIGQTRDETD
jgi:hypothetical protein